MLKIFILFILLFSLFSCQDTKKNVEKNISVNNDIEIKEKNIELFEEDDIEEEIVKKNDIKVKEFDCLWTYEKIKKNVE